MDQGNAASSVVCANSRQPGSDGSTDVIAKNQIQSAFKWDQATAGQNYNDAHRGRGTLNQHGKNGSGKYAQNGVSGKTCHKIPHHLRLTQGHDRRRHHIEADEEQTKANDDLTPAFHYSAAADQQHRYAGNDERKSVMTNIESD